MTQDNSSIPKKIYQVSTSQTILSAVNKLADLLQPTYGKNGKGVLIDNGLESSVFDDAFNIVEELEFEDPFENAVLKFIREATRKTNKRAGDGRTTTILLLRALLEGLKDVKGEGSVVEKELTEALNKAVASLRAKAEKISTVEQLKEVAMVAFHNEKIASMVAELVFKVGADGNIAVEESELLETVAEVREGFCYDRGYSSPYMVTNVADMNAELNNPHILIVDGILTSFDAIAPVLSHLSAQSQRLLVVGDVEGAAMQALLINKLNGKLLSVATKGFPGRKGFYEDLATAVGAQVFSPSKGDTVATIEMCGHAEKAIITDHSTAIIGVKGDAGTIAVRVDMLKKSLEGASEWDAREIKNRIAVLTNGVGLLKVGGMTDGERRFVKAKAEDCVHATQLALKGGAVVGGGSAFYQVASDGTGSVVLDEALKYPFRVLHPVIDLKPQVVHEAVEVCVVALESATSIALRLHGSEGIITTK